jgi:hypothetical protein
VEDLKGCWQSADGDIDIVSDDPAKKPKGKARYCYCFNGDGHGTALVRFTDGDVCRTPLRAKTTPGKVLLHHDQINCRRHDPLIGENITCPIGEGNETTCETQNLGRTLHDTFPEKLVRVTEEYCGWSG